MKLETILELSNSKELMDSWKIIQEPVTIKELNNNLPVNVFINLSNKDQIIANKNEIYFNGGDAYSTKKWKAILNNNKSNVILSALELYKEFYNDKYIII